MTPKVGHEGCIRYLGRECDLPSEKNAGEAERRPALHAVESVDCVVENGEEGMAAFKEAAHQFFPQTHSQIVYLSGMLLTADP